jgi:hypothetical protein
VGEQKSTCETLHKAEEKRETYRETEKRGKENVKKQGNNLPAN